MDLETQSIELKKTIKSNKNYSQSKMAKYCGVSASIVSQWVNGKQKISDSKKSIIDEYFEVNKNELTMTKKVNKLKKVNKNKKEDESSELEVPPPKINEKYMLIKNDLADQLEAQEKFGKHYEDLIDHAVYLFKLKDELQEDIDLNGIRVSLQTGNGHIKLTDNASIKNLNAVSAQLMRVLKGLGLDEPEVNEGFSEDDFV